MMSVAKIIVTGIYCFIATTVAAQEQELRYPPADVPLYLKCKMQGAAERKPLSDWLGLALYFPEGIAAQSPKLKIIDQHNQLEGGSFAFQIKAKMHWSLIDADGVPSAKGTKNLPQIMFLPPSGNGETLKVYFLKNGEPMRTGVCFGMAGPNTTAAFEQSLADPNGLDE